MWQEFERTKKSTVFMGEVALPKHDQGKFFSIWICHFTTNVIYSHSDLKAQRRNAATTSMDM
jgi:hypothetical protein